MTAESAASVPPLVQHLRATMQLTAARQVAALYAECDRLRRAIFSGQVRAIRMVADSLDEAGEPRAAALARGIADGYAADPPAGVTGPSAPENNQ